MNPSSEREAQKVPLKFDYLAEFYKVDTVSELIAAQAHHVQKLQMTLRERGLLLPAITRVRGGLTMDDIQDLIARCTRYANDEDEDGCPILAETLRRCAAALSTQPRPIEEERRHFEADAAPYGFDLTRDNNTTGEPWCDYRDHDTGHRWAGWLASRAPHQVPSTQPQQAGWMPIETAPKDGTHLLLMSRKGRIADGCWVDANGRHGFWAWSLVLQEPTHWMPLPLPPVPGQEGVANADQT